MTDERELHDDYEPDYVHAWQAWAAIEQKFREQEGMTDQMREAARLTEDQEQQWRVKNSEALQRIFSQPTGLWTQADWDNWYDKVFTTMKRDDPLRPKP